jgi:hypothetical protein
MWTVPGLWLPRRRSTPMMCPRRLSHRLPRRLSSPMVKMAAPVETGTSTTTKTTIAIMVAATTATAVEVVVSLLARSPPHWFRRKEQRTMADLRPPVVGAHDYVPQPRVRWTAVFIGLHGHIGSLRVSQPPI